LVKDISGVYSNLETRRMTPKPTNADNRNTNTMPQ